MAQPVINQPNLNLSNLINPVPLRYRWLMPERDRLVDLLQRAHDGDAWHGPR